MENTTTQEWIVNNQKLYIMHNAFGYMKIGISTDPERRRSKLQNASGVKVEVLFTSQTIGVAKEAEKWLHKHFKKARKMGEWFEGLKLEDIVLAFKQQQHGS